MLERGGCLSVTNISVFLFFGCITLLGFYILFPILNIANGDFPQE